MGLFDGADGPVSEVADALSDLGATDEADSLNKVTDWIHAQIEKIGQLPVARSRFLIGDAPQPGTKPTDHVDWSDALMQAGNLGAAGLDSLGAAPALLGGSPLGDYATLGTAIAENELNKAFGTGFRDDHENPMHWVFDMDVVEGLSQLWKGEITVLKPDFTTLLPFLQAALPTDVISQYQDAFNDSNLFDGDVTTAIATTVAALMNPAGLADGTGGPAPKVWSTENPDAIDLNPNKITASHAVNPAAPVLFVGRTKADDYLGRFARLSIARRFNDTHFTLSERWFTGIVTGFEDQGLRPGTGIRQTKLTVRPRMFQLSLRSRYRVFKNMNAVEIAVALLEEHGIYPREPQDTDITALRLEPGGRELFGPIGVPDQLTSAVDSIAGAVPNDWGTGVGDAINSVLEEPLYTWRPRRDFCVQYGETDLEFVERLLAEEGLVYFFDHRETRETLVICEDPRLAGKKVLTAARKPLTIATTGGNSQPLQEIATNIAVTRMPAPSGVTIRDRSYARPYTPMDLKAGESLDMLSPTGLSSLGTLGGLEQMANQVVGLATEAAGSPGTEDYAGPEAQWFEWPGPFAFPETEEDDPLGYDAYNGPPMAQLQLEAFRSRGAIARGTSDCATLVPGSHVNIEYQGFDVLHSAVQKPQRFMITKVHHRGTQAVGVGANPYDFTFTNDFEAVNSTYVWRPERPRQKPRIQGVITAFVVDRDCNEDPTSKTEVVVPALQSAWRIRVRFPWERGDSVVGAKDDDGWQTGGVPQQGSHWLRFSQPYSGAGFGAMLVPRIGMEVIVGFEDGDPDRPYVLGTLYSDAYDSPTGARHASSGSPADPEAGRIDTQERLSESGFTSRAWPQDVRGSEAIGNRLRLDDLNDGGTKERPATERIWIDAAKDYAKEVGTQETEDDDALGDHVTTVGKDQVNLVEEGTQTEWVGGNQTLLARHPSDGDEDYGRTAKVAGEEHVAIGKEKSEDDEEEEEDDEEGEKPATKNDVIELDDRLIVEGARTLEVTANETLEILGEGAKTETPGKGDGVPGRSLLVSGKSDVKVELNDEFDVTGDRRIQVKGAFDLKAAKQDMKVVVPGENGEEGKEVGGIEFDDEGAHLKSEGSISLSTDKFNVKSNTDRILVKAATEIFFVLENGTWLRLRGSDKTIHVNLAPATKFWEGTKLGAFVELAEDHLLLQAGASKWEVSLAADGAQSELNGPTVTFEATDEIALVAPEIPLGKVPEDT